MPGGIRRAASGKESTRLFSFPPFRIPYHLISQNKKRSSSILLLLGVPGGIRTPDLKVRSLAFYPAKLRAHTLFIIALIIRFFKYFLKICEILGTVIIFSVLQF